MAWGYPPRWPVAECLHENRHEQVEQVSYASERPVRIDPAFCPDCQYVWPVEHPGPEVGDYPPHTGR